MSSQKYTLTKNMDQQPLISEKISNQSSMKENYIWNMLGTISSSLISVILLLLASRLLDSRNSDIFSIAYALGQQFFVLGYFQIRNMQSTDVKERYSFVSYHNTRIVTIIMMLITSLGYVFVQGYDLYKAIIILLLVFYRAIDAYSDVFQGYFQQRNRSDLAGKVQFFRSWVCILVFGLSLLLTKSLLLSSGIICLINLFLTAILDYRVSINNFKVDFLPSIIKDRKNITSILKEAFPLFLNGFLITYVYNEAKIDIDLLLTQGFFSNGIQRDFNVLFMPVFVGVIIIGLGYLIGTEILGLVYGTSLVEYKVPFAILLAGGILNVLALVIDIVMTIFRKQSYLVISYIATFIVAKLATLSFVRSEGILGASLSFLISMIIFFSTSIIIYIWVNNKDKRKRS